MPDFKHILRALLKAPGFTLAVLFTLALGIGANASIFSLLDQMMWRPLPYKDPKALVIVHEINLEQKWNVGQFSGPNFLDFRKDTQAFTGMAGFMNWNLNLGGDGKPEVLNAGRVSANFFDVLGVQPSLGRTFNADEEKDGAHRVVILSDEFWKRRFGGDPAILGRALRLDGQAWQVVGVMPKGFRFSYRLGAKDLYFPFALTASESSPGNRGNHFFSGVARMKPDITPELAAQDMARVMAGLAKTYPDNNFGYSAGVRPLQAAIVGPKRQGQLTLLAAVAGLVLLIACVNVANLLLARNLSRRQELAIRAALGADRVQLLGQLMAESLTLSFLGGLLGILVSYWITAGLLKVVNLPVGVTPELGLRTFLVMMALTIVTSLLFGALPAWQSTRGDLVPGLREGAKGSASAGTHRLRSALVVGEVALATALLVATGLMLRSLWRLQSMPLGFEPKALITGNVNPPEATHGEDAKIRAFTGALVQRLTETPGVEAAAITDSLPMGGSSSDSGYSVEGEAPLPPGRFQATFVHRVTPGFLRTMGIQLKAGRDFTWTEGPETCLVSESFAKTHFKDASPLGKRVHIGGGPGLEIVGLVATTEQFTPGTTVLPHLYRPLQGFTGYSPLQVVVRAKGQPMSLKAILPASSAALDPDLPMDRVITVQELVDRSMDGDRSQGLLMASFAVIALLLALVGIYGLMSFIARGRTQELGIRAALGATLQDLIRLIVGQGTRLVVIGLTLGLLAAAFVTRSLTTQLQGISNLDLGTYAAVAGLLGFTALLACLFPALRAARVDPAVALRSE